jgi:DNA-binding transcriptional LysR family regulator
MNIRWCKHPGYEKWFHNRNLHPRKWNETPWFFVVPESPPLAQSNGMEVTYELTQRDFFDSFIAHRNRSAFSKWTFRIAVAIVFIFAGGGLALLVVRPNTQTLSNLAPLFAMAVMCGALMWAFPWWAARNQFLKQPAAQGRRTMLLDSSGVHWRWNGGSADVEWKNFIRFRESRHQFLLYSSPACFNIVPKRALTPEQMSEFRTLLAQNLSHSR